MKEIAAIHLERAEEFLMENTQKALSFAAEFVVICRNFLEGRKKDA